MSRCGIGAFVAIACVRSRVSVFIEDAGIRRQ
jgi:hypothetical protein